MSVDGELDCSGFSDEQLEAILRMSDANSVPLDYAKLQAEHARRQAGLGPSPLPPVAPLVPAAPAPRVYPMEFRGQGSEYYRIWIVNLLLSLVTLGIYSAWAKVRKQRYLYSNTLVDGSALGYHADPLKILRGRLIAAALFALYYFARRYAIWTTILSFVVLGAVWPWLLVRSRMFALRMTSWRGLRFSFSRDYQGSYVVVIGWMLLSGLTIGILYPRAVWERYQYLVTRSRFGQSAFTCAPRLKSFYVTAAGTIGIVVLWTIVMLVVLGIVTAAGKSAEMPNEHLAIAVGIAVAVLYLLAFSWLRSYTQARNLNQVLGTTEVGPVRLRCQLKASTLLGLYLSNGLGIIFTLGLYTPWAEIRVARYRMKCLQLECAGSLDEFDASHDALNVGAAGEEISEFFDLDFGL